jgi:predicted ATPase
MLRRLRAARYGADWTESALARVAPRDSQGLTAFVEFMRGISLCALDAKRFQAESVSEDPVLAIDGSNRASWYRHQIQAWPDRVHSVGQTLRTVIERFASIRTERVGSEARAFMVAFPGTTRATKLRLEELSDGQRALIALCSLVLLAGDQDVLSLDEQEWL